MQNLKDMIKVAIKKTTDMSGRDMMVTLFTVALLALPIIGIISAKIHQQEINVYLLEIMKSLKYAIKTTDMSDILITAVVALFFLYFYYTDDSITLQESEPKKLHKKIAQPVLALLGCFLLAYIGVLGFKVYKHWGVPEEVAAYKHRLEVYCITAGKFYSNLAYVEGKLGKGSESEEKVKLLNEMAQSERNKCEAQIPDVIKQAEQCFSTGSLNVIEKRNNEAEALCFNPEKKEMEECRHPLNIRSTKLFRYNPETKDIDDVTESHKVEIEHLGFKDCRQYLESLFYGS